MSALFERVKAARASGDPRGMLAEIPYARWLGLDVEISPEGDLLGLLRFQESNIGNAALPALHGGAIGALLEWTAAMELVFRVELLTLPKTITFTVEYLRPARLEDTRARATVTRQSRRLGSVRVEAFQQDPSKPVATATAIFLVAPPAT